MEWVAGWRGMRTQADRLDPQDATRGRQQGRRTARELYRSAGRAAAQRTRLQELAGTGIYTQEGDGDPHGLPSQEPI